MKKKDCVFCNFNDKEVIIHDDNLCYAIISRNPINGYHVMVIPKQHYKDFIELPDKLATHIFLIAKKLSKAIRKVYKADAISHLSDDDISQKGINLVEHYKFHIIPIFKKNMEIINYGALRNNETYETRSKFAKDIKKHMK